MSNDGIVEQIAEALYTDMRALRSRSRTQHVAEARQIAMYVLRRARPELSLVAIGSLLGRRDHTTVIYGIQRVEERAKAEPNFALRLVAALQAVGVRP